MFKIAAITSRDLNSWFHATSFYFLATLFFALTGYFFWSGLSYFSLVSFQVATNPDLQVKSLNLTEGVLSVFLQNMAIVMLLLTPIFTMRSFAEEKRAGTLELLHTYPVSDVQIVLGKFLGLVGILAVLVFPTMIYFFLAEVVGAKFEWASLVSGYVGLFLLGASFVSLGMFVSSLTEHQAMSAGIGFVILLFFWMAGWMSEWTGPALGNVLREFSLIGHFSDLTRGVADTKDIAFFIIFVLFFLFASLSTLGIRSWKK
jgi:ABC-2 type transport system permease protein